MIGQRLRCAVLVAAGLVVTGCGEKITLPQAEGIAVVSEYIDATPRSLADDLQSVNDVATFGTNIAVCDSAAGRVVLLSGRTGRVIANREPIEGLVAPVAIGADRSRNLFFVVQPGGEGYVVRVYDFRLDFEAEYPLDAAVRSVADVASDGSFVYVSDPAARTVHRIALVPAPGIGPLIRQGTMVAPDPTAVDIYSVRAVRQPAGLATDGFGLVAVCDVDPRRNWVIRYDPLAPDGEPEAPGSAVIFGPSREELAGGPLAFDPSTRCGDVFAIQAITLGRAPGCNDPGFEGDVSEAEGEFHAPTGVAFDGDGSVYVADRQNGRIQRFSSDGAFDAEFGPGLATGENELQQPIRLAVWDGEARPQGATGVVRIPGARVFVVDAATGRLRIYEDSRWTPFRDQS